MNRRNFIISSSIITGASIAAYYSYDKLNFFSSFSKQGLVLGGGQAMMNGSLTRYLTLLDLDQKPIQSRYVPLTFFPHGIAFHPTQRHLLSIFEKKGPGAVELNLVKGSTRPIPTTPTRYFYGHGAYSKDGKILYSTEAVIETGEGLISIRNPDTLEAIDEFPTYGANPHDCQLIEDGTVLAITNGGGPFGTDQKGCVTYVDVASRRLISRFEIENDRLNAGHLMVSAKKELAVISAPRLGLPEQEPGGISILSNQNILRTMTEPQEVLSKFKSETLSLCIDEVRGIIGATNPKGNIVTFWNLSNGQLIKAIDIPKPRGIVMTLQKAHYLVNQGDEANLIAIDTDTLTIAPHINIPKAGFSGSHIYVYSLG